MKSIKYILGFGLMLLCTLSNAQVNTIFNNDRVISNKGQFQKGYEEKVNFNIPKKNISELLV